jgi:hypothetical protein
MRRFVSIVILLLWCAGPVWALLPGSDDTQLPACCRRHGAHHCAMAGSQAMSAVGKHLISAPSHCPFYRISASATLPACLASQQSASRPAIRQHLGIAGMQPAFLSGIGHAHSGRAPPPTC